MSPRAHVRLIAGVAAPLLFAATAVLLTVHEHAFLRASGWSAVHRSAVEWPSVLALGPDGWIFPTVLLVVAVLGVLFADGLRRLTALGAVTPTLIAILALATGVEALRADRPGQSTWHGHIHNLVYPAVPAAAILAALLLAYTLRNRWRVIARVSLATAVVLILAVVAGVSSASVAQLARFFLFAALLLWLETLALAVWLRERQLGS